MKNDEHKKYGEGIKTPEGMSRWFRGEPNLSERQLIPVEQRWICPIENCGGEMEFNGFVWPTGNRGYHHTCNRCKFTAAVYERYPKITYKQVDE